jgi:hypothetical protein
MQQRWLTWLVFLVLGYLVFSGSRVRAPEEVRKPASIPVVTAKDYPALAEATDIERWKRALNPEYAALVNCTLDKTPDATLSFKAVDDALGTGAGARCGEGITVELVVWAADGTKRYAGEVPLSLGAREVASGLDYGLMGLGIDGVRTLVLPPASVVRNPALKDAPAPDKKLLAALPAGKLAVVTVKRLK